MRIKLIALFPMLLTLISVQSAFATIQENDPPSETWNVKTNQQVQLVADVTNNQNVKQPFVYIVQVLDNEGKSIMVTWVQGILQPHQSMSPSQSWIPTKPGTYTAQIFDWPCLDLCGALSFPLEMKIIVT
ncbi:MAG: hypothetical protein HY222_04840 [Thaumarchaeota archaeon]|nr:hypothetical protein [Nitrososphaerota archaeon]MBI3641701.1 hypothetical protein [Nitrososphaerota archaeon]